MRHGDRERKREGPNKRQRDENPKMWLCCFFCYLLLCVPETAEGFPGIVKNRLSILPACCSKLLALCHITYVQVVLMCFEVFPQDKSDRNDHFSSAACHQLFVCHD